MGKKQFAATTFELDDKTFVVYVASLTSFDLAPEV